MLRMRVSENLGQIFLRYHACLPSPARASQNISCLPSGCSAPCQGRWEGLSPIPPAWSPAQRNEWCSTLQKKVMEQRLVGSRPRPANTAHCQKSGTLELKGHKSKVFAALSLPEMWLYKSEQVRGPTGMRGMEGAEPGLVPRGEQGWAGKREWQSRKLEILPRAAVTGTRSGAPPNHHHLHQIIIILVLVTPSIPIHPRTAGLMATESHTPAAEGLAVTAGPCHLPHCRMPHFLPAEFSQHPWFYFHRLPCSLPAVH